MQRTSTAHFLSCCLNEVQGCWGSTIRTPQVSCFFSQSCTILIIAPSVAPKLKSICIHRSGVCVCVCGWYAVALVLSLFQFFFLTKQILFYNRQESFWYFPPDNVCMVSFWIWSAGKVRRQTKTLAPFFQRYTLSDFFINVVHINKSSWTLPCTMALKSYHSITIYSVSEGVLREGRKMHNCSRLNADVWIIFHIFFAQPYSSNISTFIVFRCIFSLSNRLCPSKNNKMWCYKNCVTLSEFVALLFVSL